MSTIKRINRERRKEESVAVKEHRRELKELREQINWFHLLFREKLMEINNKTISRLKIQIVERKNPSAPTYKQLVMIINKIPYVIFYVKSAYHYCNCSSCSEGGSCGDPGPTGPFLAVKVETCDKEKFSYPPLETISGDDIKDEEKFSTIIMEFLEDFKDSQNRIKI